MLRLRAVGVLLLEEKVWIASRFNGRITSSQLYPLFHRHQPLDETAAGEPREASLILEAIRKRVGESERRA
jgi:hypothetical protein